MFAAVGNASDPADADSLPIDERKMEDAMTTLAGDAEKMNEDDPKEAARLMRKFSSMTGLKLGGGMEEALGRMEAGEDPDAIEAEIGDVMESEDPFVLPDQGQTKAGRQEARRSGPRRDETLYEM